MDKTYFILILIMILLSISCNSDVASYPEMSDYYHESCDLMNTSKDSVDSFNSKFLVFTEKNPAAVKDSLYPHILENTFTATKSFTVKKKDYLFFLRW